MKTIFALVIAGLILVTTMAAPVFAASKTNRVSIRYDPPKNPLYQPIYLDLKQHEAFTKLQQFLSPIRLP